MAFSCSSSEGSVVRGLVKGSLVCSKHGCFQYTEPAHKQPNNHIFCWHNIYYREQSLSFCRSKHTKRHNCWKCCLLKHFYHFYFMCQKKKKEKKKTRHLYDKMCRIICPRTTDFLGMLWVWSAQCMQRKPDDSIIKFKGKQFNCERDTVKYILYVFS